MNGIVKPIALVRGKAVATWTLPGGEVALQPFDSLSGTVTKALARDAADVHRFLRAEAAPDPSGETPR